jgi:putative phage-type endonuclease
MSEIEQNSDEWHQLRCGKFTGSSFDDLLAVSKKDGKPLKARNDLIWRVASERIQGYQPTGANSYSMQWGKNNEALAREAYELRTGEFVEAVPFIQHVRYDFVGVSPDGLVNTEGGIEIKCPKNPEIHLQRFIDGVPAEYVAQIQGALWVTGRKWWDFVSYDPDTDPKFQLLIIRVFPDKAFIKRLQDEAINANNEVEAIIKMLNAKAA